MISLPDAAAHLKAGCGEGAFSVRSEDDVSWDDQGICWTLWLDPDEPFLNDHRPGGKPLFGTVGDIEAMSAGAARLLGVDKVFSLLNLRVGRPVVFETQTPRQIQIHAQVIGAPPSSALACRLITVGETGEQEHASCIFPAECEAGAQFPGSPSAAPRLVSPVDGREIYRAFFHGPAFQVIVAVERIGDRMVAALSPALPAWTRGEETTYAAPRLIEFAMQTAGLLHLARSGEMLIPHGIGRIERASPLDVNGPMQLFASAGPPASGVEQALDIDILDAEGQLHMRICDYVCTPLPYASDNAALAALRVLLNARPCLD